MKPLFDDFEIETITPFDCKVVWKEEGGLEYQKDSAYGSTYLKLKYVGGDLTQEDFVGEEMIFYPEGYDNGTFEGLFQLWKEAEGQVAPFFKKIEELYT